MDYVESKLRNGCPECGEDKFPLEEILKSDTFDKDGFCLELGVHSGHTINMMARYMPSNQNIWGFDSFEGLPEEWHDGNSRYEVGAFSRSGHAPRVASNVKLMIGWFDRTLEPFQKEILKDRQISLLHVDCDIYSSTKCAFDVFKNNIGPGTVIVFDELWNYPDYRNHEIKAFAEFLESSGLDFEPLLCRRRHYVHLGNKEVAVRIIAK